MSTPRKGKASYRPDKMANMCSSTAQAYTTIMNSDLTRLRKLLHLQTHQLQSCLGTNCLISKCKSLESKRFRKKCFQQIQALHYYYGGSESSFAVSMTTLDFFLSRVQMKSTCEKQVGCLSAACYLIASKFVEDESQVTVSSLVAVHLNQWTSDDLRRMEKWVLQKLYWQVPSCVYLNFLQDIYIIISRTGIGLPSMQTLHRRATTCMQEDFSLVMKPSSLALGVVEYSLQAIADAHVVYPVIMDIQTILQICDSELYECSSILQRQEGRSAEVHKVKPSFPLKIYRRPSWEGSSELAPIAEERNGEEPPLCGSAVSHSRNKDVFEEGGNGLQRAYKQSSLPCKKLKHLASRTECDYSSDRTEEILFKPKTKCHIPITAYDYTSGSGIGVSVR